MAGIARATQYKGNIVFSKKPHEFYENNEISYVSLRLTPIIFQSMCFPLIYLSMRYFQFSYFASLSASLILIFDTSITAEGKYILSDGLLHFFSCLHIFAVALLYAQNLDIQAILCGVTLGCAISCKNTALGLIIFTAVVQLFWIYNTMPDVASIFYRAALILLPAIFIYILGFTIHYLLLWERQDSFGYIDSLSLNLMLDKTKFPGYLITKGSIFFKIFQLLLKMHASNMKIVTPHISGSMPINWPFLMDRRVYFYGAQNRIIACMGNPFVYYASSISLGLTMILIFFKLDHRHFFLLFGWIVSYIPFVLIPRVMFLYHYIIPLFFAVMNYSALIETILPQKLANFVLFVTIIVCCYGYWYFSPYVYGSFCPNCDQKKIWDERWINGPNTKQIDDEVTEVRYTTLPEW
ncbi:hypothetical protein TVAG_117070 [Trichomonas vaginalis G3]|uniref:Uncharacterized protein n=1 Tax=Trichomonas vaginalis (strain ATCC PRA-98 / G3) TaxID=412133 RepID=A2E3P7_TRIV3|nr:dolichyl-phosphate-mannose-protein mannosyltransferase protein [Trichomonas vaginalis G3]EAY12685.1 hypothetical protein TVAG_117070 [Trichomonas vaginalis G3]KAI5517553.1 dolichyl-phosphate-mannose-protein mannosyltransferase protein [Trichomonas vaginalis G3]|eukprot:XP_001324908.1 hypothetical protein [Trichomonas vaginalis G3]